MEGTIRNAPHLTSMAHPDGTTSTPGQFPRLRLLEETLMPGDALVLETSYLWNLGAGSER